MAFARRTGQDAFSVTGTDTVTATYPGATVRGNLLLAFVWAVTGTTPTLTGWTPTGAATNSIASSTCSLFTKIATGSETTVTATLTGGGAMQMQIYEYSGLGNTISLDGFGASNGTSNGTTQVTGTLTTTDPLALVMSCAQQGNTNGGSTSWATSTLLQANVTSKFLVGQYLPGTVLSGFQDTATWLTSRTRGGFLVAFKARPRDLYKVS